VRVWRQRGLEAAVSSESKPLELHEVVEATVSKLWKRQQALEAAVEGSGGGG